MQGGGGPLPLILAWLDSSNLKKRTLDSGGYCSAWLPRHRVKVREEEEVTWGSGVLGSPVEEAARDSQVRAHWEVGLSVGGHLTE